MMAKVRSLGRGLDALMAEMGAPADPAAPAGVAVLPVGLVDPSPIQPRRQFDEPALRELADSIRVKGVLQPILVRPVDGGRYEIVAGERRWRACQIAGLHEIPVIIKSMAASDGFEAALVENIQRQDLNPIEEAEGYRRLVVEYGHTQEMVAALTGKARSHVGNLLRVLDLPANAQALVRMGILSLGHAKALLSARDPDAAAREVAERGLTVRQAEELAKRSHDPPRPARARSLPERDADLEALELQLMEAVGVPVHIESRGAGGQVVLRFSSLDQLDGIVARLQG